MNRLLALLLVAFLASFGVACPQDDDDDSAVDDDDATVDDDDATVDDDDATGDDDDATGDDDDATGDDDDATGDDDDATGDDDDATGDDDDSAGDDDDSTPDPCLEDADADGVTLCGPDGISGTADDDCDDNDPTNFPGNTEVCDEADNDCDGSTFAAGEDEDLDADGVIGCLDCDDADGANFPGNTEVCDGVDNDCDGTTWAADEDTDGDSDGVVTCLDCDDADAANYPGRPEVCDGQDNDCDAATWAVGEDTDGDTDGVVTCLDCDDADGANYPGNTEVCDEADNDCDGTTWAAGEDTDGDADGVVTCLDCDDADGANYPGNTEVCDGQDNDCDGSTWATDEDTDADADGTVACLDCNDSEPSVAVLCREDPGCVTPDATTIAANDPPGATDLAFDPDTCSVYVCGIISGNDDAHVIAPGGTYTLVNGYSNYNHTAIALNPSVPGDFYVSHNENTYTGIGHSAQAATITHLYGGTYNAGTLWSNYFLNQNQSSLAMDSAGCLWAPNLTGSGSLSCIDAAGTVTDVVTGLATRPESVALDAAESVYISLGAELHQVDTSTGGTTVVYTAGADILDVVFDYNGDIYIETTAGEIELVPGDGTAGSVFQTVTGQGKLAISPNGWLVRMIPVPTGAATYEEWQLGP